MTEQKSKLKAAGVFIDANAVDISRADIDLSLAKVWTDDGKSEIAVSVDRVLFDQMVDIAARYLEPQGYSLNLENLLATMESMKIGVFASVSSKSAPDGRAVAKKLMPHVYMHLPRKDHVGPLLRRFYDEIGKYERELARLHDAEAKAKKSVESAVKDESGKKAVQFLQNENAALREELAKLGRKLAAAEQLVSHADKSSDQERLPGGVRVCSIRSIRLSDGAVIVKCGESQFSVSLKMIGAMPAVNARALGYFEGGVIRDLWVFDPATTPFQTTVATVMAVDGRRVKLRFSNRGEKIVPIQSDPAAIKVGSSIIAVFAGSYLIDMTLSAQGGESRAADLVFDEQTRNQIAEMFERGAA